MTADVICIKTKESINEKLKSMTGEEILAIQMAKAKNCFTAMMQISDKIVATGFNVPEAVMVIPSYDPSEDVMYVQFDADMTQEEAAEMFLKGYRRAMFELRENNEGQEDFDE